MFERSRQGLKCQARWVLWKQLRALGLNDSAIGAYTGHTHCAVSYGVDALERDRQQLVTGVLLNQIAGNVEAKMS